MIALFFLVTHGLNGPVRGGLMLQPANGRTRRSEALITGAWATCGHRPFLRGRRRDETTEVQSPSYVPDSPWWGNRGRPAADRTPRRGDPT